MLTWLFRPYCKSLSQASASVCFAAVNADIDVMPTAHIVNNCWFTEPSAVAMNAHLQKTCLSICDQMISEFEQGQLGPATIVPE